MRLPRKMIVFTAVAAVALVGGAAIKAPKKETPYKNLKVLPADISSRQLLRLMTDVFQDELGVSCSFCHAENKETHKPDYASDEKPEKEIARMMIRMTNGINKDYFGLTRTVEGDSLLEVSCGTCHKGNPHP
jgi:cytochrome c5